MNYYNHYFKTNWDYIKSNWKGIKSILNVINNQSDIPKILVSNDSASTEPTEIANISNNFLTSITAKTKESIKYSNKHFLNFRKNRSEVSLKNMNLSISYPLLIQTNQLDLIVYLLRY